jgi:hypothetical protein
MGRAPCSAGSRVTSPPRAPAECGPSEPRPNGAPCGAGSRVTSPTGHTSPPRPALLRATAGQLRPSSATVPGSYAEVEWGGGEVERVCRRSSAAARRRTGRASTRACGASVGARGARAGAEAWADRRADHGGALVHATVVGTEEVVKWSSAGDARPRCWNDRTCGGGSPRRCARTLEAYAEAAEGRGGPRRAAEGRGGYGVGEQGVSRLVRQRRATVGVG